MIQHLVAMGALHDAQDVAFTELREIECAYVLLDDAYGPATATIHQWLRGVGVRACGRYGAWIYNSMEDSIIQGMEAAAWAEA